MASKNEILKAKKLINYIRKLSNQNTKVFSKVFIEFSKEIAKDNGYKFATGDPKILYNKLRKSLIKAFSSVFNLNTNRGTPYINSLFGFGIKNKDIPSISNSIIKQYSSKNAVKMAKLVTNSVKKTINKIITQGQSQGINQRDIVKKITDKVSGMSKSRARTIARTETSKTINITENTVADEAGMTEKEWVYTHISKSPREAHVALDGTVIKINESFNVNGFEGKYPHDPNLPPSEVINCECVVIYK